MNWLAGVSLFIKLIPCIVSIAGEMNEAKKDDGNIDAVEWGKIAEDGFKCIVEKLLGSGLLPTK